LLWKEKIRVHVYLPLKSSYTWSWRLHTSALEWILLTLKHTIIRIRIALRERGCDSKNFGTRITWFRVTVEKIWRKEIWRAKIWVWKVLGTYFEICRGFGEFDLQFGAKGGVKV
jgi:hypothetical protein